MNRALGILLILVSYQSVYGWDHEELEIFDIVEEVNENFYELMGIKQVSCGNEVL